MQPLLDYRHVDQQDNVESALHTALADFAPMGLLINTTMKKACPIAELSKEIFPAAEDRVADTALTVLMGAWEHCPQRAQYTGFVAVPNS